jgi:tetratricopeptide (TPR) repeat protein
MHFDCNGMTTGRQLQDNIELLAGCGFTVFGKSLREMTRVIVVFFNLDYSAPGTHEEPVSANSVVEALRDYCENALFVRTSYLPCPGTAKPVNVGVLDQADTRSYLNKAPSPVHLTSSTDYVRVHRATGGLPLNLDSFVEAMAVADVEEGIAQANSHDRQRLSSLPETAVRQIGELINATTDDMRRMRSLLWALAVLDQGESLRTIKRLDDKAPIWASHAAVLQSHACIDSVAICSRLPVVPSSPLATDGDKILRVPRIVRDYVLSVMTNKERSDIIKDVATLYFSSDWRSGVVRLRQRFSIGTEISTHQSGNELSIIRNILRTPRAFFRDTPATALSLATSYINQLKLKGCYGEAYEAAKDVLAVTDSMPNEYSISETYFVSLLAASCARMVGECERSVRYLEFSLPFVREIGAKSVLADALVTLFLALQNLNRNDEARTAAKEVLSLLPRDSSGHLHAQATLAEIEMSRPEAVRFLKQLARKAKRLGHFTVADNIILEIVSDCDNTEEKLLLLNEVRSRREVSYNFVRATIRRVETLLRSNRAGDLTQRDRDDLWMSYSVCYSQRLSLFDFCHRVCWEYLQAVGASPDLGELYVHSSFFWRLRGDGPQELKYSIELASAMTKSTSTSIVSSVMGYVRRRVLALGAAVSG